MYGTSAVRVFMLLFSFSIFSNHWSLKIANENNRMKREVSYMGSQGLKNKFYSGMVNKPSVFEPLKFYSIV